MAHRTMAAVTPQDLARALATTGEPELRGDQWYTQCPAHDDQEPSLAITERNGTLVWVCRAGCTQDAVTAAVTPVLKSLAPPEPTDPAKRPRIVAEYNYTDAEAKLLYQVVRFEPGPNGKAKDFRQRRPDPEHTGNGTPRWIWNLRGIRRVLYQLPKVTESAAVVLVEGEKDALALGELGIAATCNPGGAGKWHRDYTAALTGKRVAIIADRDAAGRKHAQAVAAELHGKASSVRVLEPPHGCKDAADWCAKGADRATIAAAIKATPEWEPGPEPVPAAVVREDAGPRDPTEWPHGLLCTEHGPRAILANAMHALRAAPPLRESLSLDTFTQRLLWQRDPPWGQRTGRPWSDDDARHLAEWLQHHDVRVGEQISHSAACVVGAERSHDSLIDHVRAPTWDGKARLAALAGYLGAPTDDTSAELARLWLISAAARALRPGCQADHVLVLEGPQGSAKSSALRALFDPHDTGMFRDSLPPLDSKDAEMQLIGAWCIEIAELEAVNARRTEIERVKAFITRRVDSYRPPYGRSVQDIPRRNVFAGSTNDAHYLKDHTGNRRWWPIECGTTGPIDLPRIKADRDQLIAEAVAAYDMGEPWWVDQQAPANADVADLQESRRIRDPWEGDVAAFCMGRTWCRVTDVLQAINIPIERRSQAEANRVARILSHRVGWYRKLIRWTNGGREWLYVAEKDMTGAIIEQRQGA